MAQVVGKSGRRPIAPWLLLLLIGRVLTRSAFAASAHPFGRVRPRDHAATRRRTPARQHYTHDAQQNTDPLTIIFRLFLLLLRPTPFTNSYRRYSYCLLQIGKEIFRSLGQLISSFLPSFMYLWYKRRYLLSP